MRIARLAGPHGPRHAVSDGDEWVLVEDPFAATPLPTGVRVGAADAVLLAPVEPRIVLGMAHNSGPADRALPPQAFWKSARSVVGPGDPIRIDPRRGRVKGEAELVLVVGRECRDISPSDAPDHILGWTVGNDVTAVDQIAQDAMMVQAKSGDGFTPLGPWIETDLDPLAAGLGAGIDGGARLASSTAELAWTPYEVLAHLSAHLTLGPGDVILTGAPGTAFDLEPGDVARCTVAGIGDLVNPALPLAIHRRNP